MNLNALKVDPEFQGKIPPLTFEELNQLEANILRDGRIINPIIVWEGLIVDGHNRFIIAKKHPEIPYTVHETEFANRYEAIIWICKNPSYMPSSINYRTGLHKLNSSFQFVFKFIS